MAVLGFTNDWVQLPEDGTGKKTGYYRWDTGGGNYLYLGAGVVTGPDGLISDVVVGASVNALAVYIDNDSPIPVFGEVNTALDHDDPAGSTIFPSGGYASAAAPAAVSADADFVRAWYLRNGAQATVLTAAGALIGGDAAQGLDVDVTRLPALVAGTANIGDVDVLTVPAPLSTAGGGAEATALRVTVADDSTGVLSVDDNGGSLTVDGTVAVTNADLTSIKTAVEILDNAIAGSEMQVDIVGALPAGSANIGDVDVLTLPALVAGSANIGDVDIASIAAGTTIEAVGDVASDVPIAANPVTIGGRASSAAPTEVGADGDAVNLWLTRKGTVMVTDLPHAALDGAPYTLTGKTVQQTTTQAGTDVITPTSGKKLVVVSYQIQVGGTTAGTCQLWFGANADTTYSRGTDLAIFDGEFAPSATLKPGVVQTGIWIASAVDHEVHLTTSANMTITVTLWYYEI